MNSKRSYLETLNAGRQRRPNTTLEQITESLLNLESKLDRSRQPEPSAWNLDVAAPAAARTDYSAREREMREHDRRESELRERELRQQEARERAGREKERREYEAREQREREAARAAATVRAAAHSRPASPARPAPKVPAAEPYQAIARDIDRVRSQEEGVASVSKIAGELKGLREELRQQMTTGLQREFETLRTEIERAYSTSSATAVGTELAGEIERISSAIHNLSERSDDKSITLLRLEIDQVKRAIGQLAREETVLSADRRWDEFDRRWTDFTDKVDARNNASDPAISALSARLQTIGDAVDNLPESLSLRSLEEKVRTLAGAVDHFVRQQERRGPETFSLIEERLDEISRAIVASAAAAHQPNFDPVPFERIEARISALARQIEEVAEDRPGAEVIDRLNMLSQRVDDLAAKGAMPDKAIESLGRQIAIISQKIDSAPAMPDANFIFEGIEQRFDVFSSMIEQRHGDAIEHGNMMFRDLERRLEDLAERLDRRSIEAVDSGRVLEAINARFAALADQIDASPASDGSNAAIRGLEARLESISDRLDASSAQFAGIDPHLIRSLESQVSALSQHLARPSGALPDFEDIGPRLDYLEQSLSGSREAILEAAREAAETAVRSLSGSQAHTAAAAGLSQDLRALESLTRDSDERNSRTFEAIQDTLVKIVDRLGEIEMPEAEEGLDAVLRPPLSRKMELHNPPSIDPGRSAPAALADDDDFDDALPPRASQPGRTPAEAAAEAAMAALGSEVVMERPSAARPRSLLGGLTRAFNGGRKEAAEEAAPVDVEPSSVKEMPVDDLDMPLDTKAANRPLEPGSGAPDLNAIMKRVRDERGQPNRSAVEPDTAKSDFIAAARRAAQAAAAEAEVLKRHSEVGGPVKALRLGDMIRKRRKPILMAATAIIVALAGLQLGKAFLGDDTQLADGSGPIVGQSAQVAIAEIPADAGGAQGLAADDAMMDEATRQSEHMSAATPAVRAVDAPETPVAGEMAAAAAPQQQAVSPATQGSLSASAATEMPALPTQPAAAPMPEATAPTPPATVAAIPVEAGPVALREAAEAGDSKALFEVGSRYADGRGLTANMKEAAKWYEKSAELGFAPAQFRIGNFYEKGLGVERDIAQAKTWYQLAAAQGNASAMHNLAVLNAMGADGTADNETAARWFTAAAELGVTDSQFNLGILAAKGVGMQQNLEESYKWFALVAKTGDRDAAAKRDEIANSLRPEQLQRARGVVELWKAKTLEPEANSVEIPESWQESAGTTASVDMKKAIGNIQKILNKNGYEAGNPDGVLGEKTKQAIMAFQKDNDMPATGAVDEKLVKALVARK